MSEQLENLFNEINKSIDKEDYPVAVQKLTSTVYSELSSLQQRTGGGKVTVALLNSVKKVLDRINEILTKSYKSHVIAETKLQNQEVTNNLLKDIADSISTIKTPDSEEEVREPDYSLIIQPKQGNEIEAIKSSIRELKQADSDLPFPKDIIITKEKQLIIKLKNKKDLDKY